VVRYHFIHLVDQIGVEEPMNADCVMDQQK
jgi:hypothetical protein